MSTAVATARNSGLNARVFRAATAVTVAGVAVKLVAMAKEFVVAGVYGRTDAMDAFLVALLIPGLLVNIVSESMNQALIPTFVRVRAMDGVDRARQLLSNAMVSSCALLTVSSLAIASAARYILHVTASNYPPEKLHLALLLFYVLLPSVLLTGIASNCTAVLNTLDRFAVPALAPVVTPALTIVLALTLGSRIGIWAMAIASICGALLHALWMVSMMESHGYKIRLRWFGLNQETRDVSVQYGRVLLSSVVACSGLLVDQAMAASLPAGSVSALAYANRFVSVVLTLLGGAIASAITPSFAEAVAHESWHECRRLVRSWIGFTALVSVPIAAVLMIGAHALVSVAFQHGAFHAQDTEAVTPVLIMYAIQIPFFVCSRVFYRFLLAIERSDVILWCGVVNLVLDVVLNLILMRAMGVAGIALATSLWTISTFVFLWGWTRKLMPVERERAA
ncbi:MAG: lipid II flippase MurJ [Terracidiphilus sp.]|nr:lipid II flippase MurJ [Terracidiphilus sp.]